MRFSTLASLFLGASGVFAAPAAELEERARCSPVGISSTDKSAVVKAFSSSGVVPTLIPSINPDIKVNVAYGSKVVNLGTVLTTAQTVNQPSVAFSAEANHSPSTTRYSLFLVDPDVPNAQAGALRMPFLHWYVAHVHPSCIGTFKNSDTVTIYEPPTPASTTQHRYTFLVYREPAGYTPNIVTAQVRPGFNVNTYAAAGGLTLVGGNFFNEAITNGV